MQLAKRRLQSIFKKYKYTLVILVLCSQTHYLYNMICYQNKFIENKYRHNNIQLYYLKCNKTDYINYYDEIGLHCYPSYAFIMNNSKKIYNGTNINRLEELINSFF